MMRLAQMRFVVLAGKSSRVRAVALMAALVLGACGALLHAGAALELKPESRVWLQGDSTLHPYSSTTTQFTAAVDIETLAAPIDGKALHAALRSGRMRRFELSIPVQSLKSGESGLDKNMYKNLKAEEAPQITFKLAGYELKPLEDGKSSFLMLAKGALGIAGQAKETALEIRVSAVDGEVRAAGSREVLMTDFGIKPPTMMLGAIKTADKVVVHYDLRFELKQ